MKRITALLLALAFACALLPALAASEEIAGIWYLLKMEMDDIQIEPVEMGMSVTMTLNEDGTAKFVSVHNDGEIDEEEGTWVAEEGIFITNADKTAEYVLTDGILHGVDPNGLNAFFAREQPELEPLPAAIPAESEEAFLGDWDLTRVSDGKGAIVNASIFSLIGLNMDAKLSIKPGKASIVLELLGFKFPSEGESTFADGALTVKFDEKETTFQTMDSGEIFAMLKLPMLEKEIPSYFVRVAE